MNLTVSVNRHGDVTTVAPIGDIDLATAPPLEQALADAAEGEAVGRIEVDLSGVEFLDSSGIASLLRGYRLAEAAGLGYRIFGASGMVRQILELTGVWDHLHGSDT
jgi:anti-sigma B factor antagonist